jgi:iron(III) transport system substrate-binding protein
MLIARPSEITERVRVEVAAGRVGGDVMLHGEATLRRMAVDGLVQQSSGFSGVDDLIVPDSNPKFAAPAFMNGYGMMVNSNFVKSQDEPKSWFDLLEPKWSGKMLADDTRALGAGGIFFSVMTEKFGADYHRKLARQNIVFGRDLGADQLRIARGEFPLRWPQSLSNMRDVRGLPLRFIIPVEGLTYVRVDSAIIKGAARPNAAHLFADYMLSRAAQDMLASFGLIPVIKGAVNASDPETRDLVTRAKEKLLGTSHPETIEAMLALAKEIYK